MDKIAKNIIKNILKEMKITNSEEEAIKSKWRKEYIQATKELREEQENA